MATQLFTEILQNATNPTAAQDNARMWLREQAQSIRQVNNPRALLNQGDRLVSRPQVGRMYLFAYDPKLKDDLPYYDKFPLIFPFHRTRF